MSQFQHDLIVIGAGPGGYVAAIRAAQMGLNTACIDENEQLGGTCLRVGCIPSKALLESSELFHQAANDLVRHGIETTPKLNLTAMQQRKEQIVQSLTRGIDSLFKKNKITRYLGRATFAGPNTLIIADKQGQTQQVTSRYTIIATGSRPATLRPPLNVEHERIGSSTQGLAYTQVPKHLVVIGGGYIGLEIGSIWRRLGAKVTVLEYLDRILPTTDDEIADEALKLFKQQGFEFHLGARITAIEPGDDNCTIRMEQGEPIKCDRVLVAVGRTPNTQGLELEKLGGELTERGFIRVDEHFATKIPGVYAIGDVIGGALLAHKAEDEAVACVEGIVTGYSHIDHNLIPAVVYTHPEIASVGQTEQQLKQAGVEYRKGLFPFRASGRAMSLGQTQGKVKVLADAKTDRLLGVHIIGPRAGDMIAEAVAAMQFGASSEDLARVSHAHPTLSEALKEASLAVDGHAIHI